MLIDEKNIKQLEIYSKIELTDRERALAKTDLEEILTFMKTLSEIKTDNETQTVSEQKNIMREDEEKFSPNRDLILQNAPDVKDGCFKVPKTVE